MRRWRGTSNHFLLLTSIETEFVYVFRTRFVDIGKVPITIILAKISSFALFEVVKNMLILAKIISILANIIYKIT